MKVDFPLGLIVAVIAAVASLIYSVLGQSKSLKALGAETDRPLVLWSKIIFLVAAVVATILLLLTEFFPHLVTGSLLELSNHAFAQTTPTTPAKPSGADDTREVGKYLLIFVCGVFSVALIALFVISDTVVNQVHVNEKKIAAADTIVKTFGGLIIGLLSSIYNVHQ